MVMVDPSGKRREESRLKVAYPWAWTKLLLAVIEKDVKVPAEAV